MSVLVENHFLTDSLKDQFRRRATLVRFDALNILDPTFSVSCQHSINRFALHVTGALAMIFYLFFGGRDSAYCLTHAKQGLYHSATSWSFVSLKTGKSQALRCPLPQKRKKMYYYLILHSLWRTSQVFLGGPSPLPTILRNQVVRLILRV